MRRFLLRVNVNETEKLDVVFDPRGMERSLVLRK